MAETTKTIYLSIGNSDDKLSQEQWSNFVMLVDARLTPDGYNGIYERHGDWRSIPDAPWQNACWCIVVDGDDGVVAELKRDLANLARRFRQDSIAWAEATTEFIKPTEASHG